MSNRKETTLPKGFTKIYTSEYTSWRSMKRRCKDPFYFCSHRYILKGIYFDSSWESFEQFFLDMGPKPAPNYTLDRIDPNKGYNKDNCRWATPKEQARNISTNRVLEYNGESKPMSAWAEEFGIHPRTLKNRLDSGWTVEKALTTPVKSKIATSA